MAAASGLPLVPADKRNPLNTTTYGTGELIKDALDRGYRKISIAIGGSATNDGGMGAMRALGVRFLDDQGNELEGRGRDLTRVADIDVSRIHPAVAQARIHCDVRCDQSPYGTGRSHLYIWKAKGRYTGNPGCVGGRNGAVCGPAEGKAGRGCG